MKNLFVKPFTDGSIVRVSERTGNYSLNISQQTWPYGTPAPAGKVYRADGSTTLATQRALIGQVNGELVKAAITKLGNKLVEGYDLNNFFKEIGFGEQELVVIESTTPSYEGQAQKQTYVNGALEPAVTEAGEPIYRNVKLFDAGTKTNVLIQAANTVSGAKAAATPLTPEQRAAEVAKLKAMLTA